MKIIQTVFLNFEQKQILFELWNSEYPVNIVFNEISEFDTYLAGLLDKKHYLLMNDFEQIIGWSFTFFRDQKYWFGIIVNSEFQGQGFGTLLLNELKKNKSVLYGWVTDHFDDVKKNNDPYLSPLGFYSKNNFIVNKDIRLENDKISAVQIVCKQK